LEISVERAMELTFANNPQLKIAESDVAIADESRRQAHRARGVTITATHSSMYTDYKNEDMHLNSYATGLTATYPLYTGGVLENSIKQANVGYEAQKASLQKVIQDLRLTVAKCFYLMLQRSDMAKLNRESVERLIVHVENVRIQYENGRVGKADLLRSEVELSNAELAYISAENARDAAVKQMNNLMGVPLDTELVWDAGMKYEKFSPIFEECLSFAEANHPDLESSKLRMLEAKYGVYIARGEKRPQIKVSATQNLSSTTNWPGIKDDNFNLALNVEYTISNSGITSSRISAAQMTVEKANRNHEMTRDSVFLAVNVEYLGVREAERRIEASAEAIEKAREAYAIALNRYEEGIGTNIDVIDSQIALTQTQSNYTQALCDYNIALAQLENSMGGAFPQ
jgi:outer membrane protein TolC